MSDPKPKSPAERKADERRRMRERGYVLKQFWVHQNDWPRVQKSLRRTMRERELLLR